MTGIEPPANGWTLTTLKTVVEGEIAALQGITNARFVAVDASMAESKEAIKVGLSAAQTALGAAAALAKEAVTEAARAHASEHTANAMALALATLDMKEKLEGMNQLRQQITAERGDYVTRDRLASAVTSLEATAAATMVTIDARFRVVETSMATGLTALDAKYATSLGQAETRYSNTVKDQDVKIVELQRAKSNLEGRFTAYAAALGLGLIMVEIFLRFVIK